MRPLDLYQHVVICPLHCAGITNDPDAGRIPRSFYWGGDGREVKLLLVSKNPGTAPPHEIHAYLEHPRETWAEVHYGLTHDVFRGVRSVGTGYHANLVRRVAAILGCKATAEAVFRESAMTALVKCESAGAKTDKIPGDTLTTCSGRFFFQELELFKPAFLLALGSEVYRFLTRPEVAGRHGLPVGELYHPSWTNMKGGEAAYFRDVLPVLRTQYLAALEAGDRADAG
jgi:DNA polymerase